HADRTLDAAGDRAGVADLFPRGGCRRRTAAVTKRDGRNLVRPFRARLLLFRTGSVDAFDLERRASAFLGDLAVLLHDEAARGFVAVEAAEQFGRHAAVGALGVVLIDDVEKGEFAFGVGSGFLRHGRLVSAHDDAVHT